MSNPKSYEYVRYMRDGSVRVMTAVVRSKKKVKATNKKGNE